MLTVEQLHYSCCSMASLYVKDVEQPTAELKAAFRSAAQAMLQLEPDNPKSHVAAAEAARFDHTGRGYKTAVQGYMRAFELAQQQRSDFWMIETAADALHLGTFHPLEVGHAALAAAVAAFEAAEAALRRCKRLLPAVWERHLAKRVRLVAAFLPDAREQLPLLQQARAGGPAATLATALLQASVAAQGQVFREQVEALGPRREAGFTQCDGCGRSAVGLRRCGRCQSVHYCRCEACCTEQQGASLAQACSRLCMPLCLPPAPVPCHLCACSPHSPTAPHCSAHPAHAPCSRECQVAHWTAHKRECTPV